MCITSNTFLSVLVYNLITALTSKNLLRRFSLFKNARRDFYECGFKPQSQKPNRLSIQFTLICIFFILYDIELVFLFPWVSGTSFIGFYELVMLLLFFLFFLVSLAFDYDRHSLTWQI